MLFRRFCTSLFDAGVITVVAVLCLSVGSAQVRSSTNYQIQSDSINFGGGPASSSNYVSESTGGEVATGPSNSASFSLRAGYQQMQETFISLSAPTDIDLDGPIPGLTGGESNGSTTVTVTTDSSGGYELTIAAATAPAMQKGVDSIADYTPTSTPNADYVFEVDPATIEFGFAPTGVDIINRYKNDGFDCGVGALITAGTCWDGLSTSSRQIAVGAGANHPNGATTTIQFKVGHGGGFSVPPGIYTATTTLTALPL